MPEEQVLHVVEQQDKVCPLRMINGPSPTPSDMPFIRCIKEKCAWWNSYWGGCTISSLAKQLDLIRNSGLSL